MAHRPPTTVEIPVALTDIEEGHARSPLTCPIALAANREDTRHNWVIGVTVAARINGSTGDIDYYSLARDARDFLHEFDAGEDVQPQPVHLYHSPGARIYYYGGES
jgi:hypothetical protein